MNFQAKIGHGYLDKPRLCSGNDGCRMEEQSFVEVRKIFFGAADSNHGTEKMIEDFFRECNDILRCLLLLFKMNSLMEKFFFVCAVPASEGSSFLFVKSVNLSSK